MDESEGDTRRNDTDAAIESSIPHPHEGIADRSIAKLFEPSGDGNAVDEGEEKEDE